MFALCLRKILGIRFPPVSTRLTSQFCHDSLTSIRSGFIELSNVRLERREQGERHARRRWLGVCLWAFFSVPLFPRFAMAWPVQAPPPEYDCTMNFWSVFFVFVATPLIVVFSVLGLFMSYDIYTFIKRQVRKIFISGGR